ncbi:MAG: hypothetical protein Q7R67_01075 [bacterium]|nr:hypothetical protein [bacterium]
MTLNMGVADDQLGQYYRRTAAIADRLGKSLEFEAVMDALQRIHDGQIDPVVIRVGEFSVWLEAEVGGKSKDELIALNKGVERETSSYAADIMSKDAWQPGQVEVVKFARVKVRELGFSKNPTTTELWARIEELGHSLCQPADGPALGVAFKDQPKGDVCWMAMKQITDSDGDPSVFALGRGDGGERWLGAGWADPDGKWDLGHEIVFRLRK